MCVWRTDPTWPLRFASAFALPVDLIDLTIRDDASTIRIRVRRAKIDGRQEWFSISRVLRNCGYSSRETTLCRFLGRFSDVMISPRCKCDLTSFFKWAISYRILSRGSVAKLIGHVVRARDYAGTQVVCLTFIMFLFMCRMLQFNEFKVCCDSFYCERRQDGNSSIFT